MEKEDVGGVCVYIYIYYAAIKKNLAICDNMDGPRKHYAKLNKLDRERLIPYDFTYLWNLNNKTNKQNKMKTVS